MDTTELQSGPPKPARARNRNDRLQLLINTARNARTALGRGRSVVSIIKPLAKWVVLVTQRAPIDATDMTRLSWSRARTTALDFLASEHELGPHEATEFLDWVQAALQRPGVISTMDQHLSSQPLRFYGEIMPEAPKAHRNIGGSLLPSSEPRILQPIEVPSLGTLQVRVLPKEDAHGLFRTGGDEPFSADEPELLAQHANGYSCHELATRIAKGDKVAVMEQAIYIVACGGKLTGAGASLISCRLQAR